MTLLPRAEHSKNIVMRDGVIPEQEVLLAKYDYDPETGRIMRKETGEPAFATLHAGYLKGSVCNSRCYAHRVIWKMVHGVEPKFIDHINGDTTDNRLINLRAVEFAENCRNRKLPTNNTSGIMGVSWCSRQKSWMGTIRYDGRRHAKWFKSKDEAALWRKDMEVTLGFHENHGR